MSQEFSAQKRLPVSVVMVVYNEEDVIERAIASFCDIVDEIIIVHDGPCKDNTLAIAKKYTDNVYVKEHAGIAEHHRVFTYRVARNDWILQLDADEYASPELRSHLESLIDDESVGAYALSWPKIYKGKPYLWDYKVCLFNKKKIYFIGASQEYVKLRDRSKEPKKISYAVLHEPPYENLSRAVFKRKQMPWIMLHADDLTTRFGEIEKWNCDLGDWEWSTRVRIDHPILFGIIGSSLYHSSYNLYHFLKTGESYFFVQGYYTSLYYSVLYYHVYKKNARLRRSKSRHV
jgi:glycosyltransferase involved in cell wall biosynthesis